MNTPAQTLPRDYQALEPFVQQWAVETSNERLQQRLRSSRSEQEAFFNAIKPVAAEALAYLDQKSLDDFDQQEQHLMNLLLSFAHISLAIEIQGDDEAKHAHYAQHITITRSAADQ